MKLEPINPAFEGGKASCLEFNRLIIRYLDFTSGSNRFFLSTFFVILGYKYLIINHLHRAIASPPLKGVGAMPLGIIVHPPNPLQRGKGFVLGIQ